MRSSVVLVLLLSLCFTQGYMIRKPKFDARAPSEVVSDPFDLDPIIDYTDVLAQLADDLDNPAKSQVTVVVSLASAEKTLESLIGKSIANCEALTDPLDLSIAQNALSKTTLIVTKLRVTLNLVISLKIKLGILFPTKVATGQIISLQQLADKAEGCFSSHAPAGLSNDVVDLKNFIKTTFDSALATIRSQ
ncbi:hypothetical protein Unana1_04272 [Umbelopsis nana]